MSERSADVFCLMDEYAAREHDEPRLLAPASQASVLAMYSRSPKSARDLLVDMTSARAAAFQEKWGVTYGHSSVAELASLPFCFEGVSIIASKYLERYQRGAYSEKSTRYQDFGRDSFIAPPSMPEYLCDAARKLYDVYAALKPQLIDALRKVVAPGTAESVLNARAFDSLRYLLPAGTATNVAAVWNTRDSRYVMSDLLGMTWNSEMVSLGEKMLSAARAVAPVFAMGVKPTFFQRRLRPSSMNRLHRPRVTWSSLDSNQDRNDETHHPGRLRHRVEVVHDVSLEEFSRWMTERGKQSVPDVFKTITASFDLVMDYGAYRDLQRHRRCEQFPDLLGPHLGFDVPEDLFLEPGLSDEYLRAMGVIRKAADQAIAEGAPSEDVQYAMPLGSLHRCIFQMDLKELYYLVELRTQPQGHISYRRVAYQMFELAKLRFPIEMQWCRAINPTEIGAHT